jgi:hypothetical protein
MVMADGQLELSEPEKHRLHVLSQDLIDLAEGWTDLQGAALLIKMYIGRAP